jgi:(p)ppGpp synthase/HD superfamily hydrolase
MIFEALEFAVAAHQGQVRKGSVVPYAVHPVAAARTLMQIGCPEHVVVAAFLHDVIEDTRITGDEIRKRFGGRVAELVVGATEAQRWASWETRKKHTLDRLRSTGDEELLLVSIADKLDNISSLRVDLDMEGEAVWERFKRGRDEQRWYYRSLEEIFTARLDREPAARLARRFRAEVQAVFGL